MSNEEVLKFTSRMTDHEIREMANELVYDTFLQSVQMMYAPFASKVIFKAIIYGTPYDFFFDILADCITDIEKHYDTKEYIKQLMDAYPGFYFNDFRDYE